jgi:hypothetical protein
MFSYGGMVPHGEGEIKLNRDVLSNKYKNGLTAENYWSIPLQAAVNMIFVLPCIDDASKQSQGDGSKRRR